MNTLKNYMEAELRKTMINRLLKTAFINIPAEDFDEYTEMIMTKIDNLNTLKDNIKTFFGNGEDIKTIMEQYQTSEEEVLNSFLFMTLVVENVYLTKVIAQLWQQDKGPEEKDDE